VIIPLTSPALVIDQQRLQESIQQVNYLRERSACQVLYSIKALPLLNVLRTLQPFVDGFSVSSLFEAKLATEVLMPAQSIHLTTPGIRPDEMIYVHILVLIHARSGSYFLKINKH